MEPRSIHDVIELLGGPKAVAAICKANVRTVYVWKNTNRFPAHSYPALTAALADRCISAPIKLWPTIRL